MTTTRLRTAALPVLLASATLCAQAGLVDTGEPPQGALAGGWSLTPAQSVAASFAFDGAETIRGVEAFMNTGQGGHLTVTLYAGAPTTGLGLYGTTVAVGPLAGWAAVGGLSWAVSAGATYTVAFSTTDVVGYMPGGAPNALGTEWLTLGGDWGGAWTQLDGIDIGLRVAATPTVPEPATAALMLTGLGAAALVGARRRAARAELRTSAGASAPLRAP